MKVYVVNYKETTLGEDNVMSVDSGICDYGYKNEENGLQWIIQSARLGYNDAIELLQVIDSNEE